MEQYHKRLLGVEFTVSLKGRRAIVKLGRKYNVAMAADKSSAQALAEELNLTVRHHRNRISEALDLLEKRCEQLNIFSKENENGAERRSAGSAGLVSDTVGKSEAGGESAGGFLDGAESGDINAQHGAVDPNRSENG